MSFRIPWITGSSTESQPRRAKQKPPFRPPGIASAPPQSPSIPFYNRIMFRRDKKQRETVDRNIMLATSTPTGKDTKVVTSAPADAVTRNITLSNDEISKFVQEQASVDDKTISVVTLAGDNRGATMHAESSHSDSIRKKKGTNHNEEGKEEAGKAYVNSNIQSLNNSFMLHGSINGRDPGVRVILPQQPNEKPCIEKQKAEVKINRAERPSYQPVVRRRCLRGLFMEPSDSDPDKPRRHGCKFTCGEIQKDHQ